MRPCFAPPPGASFGASVWRQTAVWLLCCTMSPQGLCIASLLADSRSGAPTNAQAPQKYKLLADSWSGAPTNVQAPQKYKLLADSRSGAPTNAQAPLCRQSGRCAPPRRTRVRSRRPAGGSRRRRHYSRRRSRRRIRRTGEPAPDSVPPTLGRLLVGDCDDFLAAEPGGVSRAVACGAGMPESLSESSFRAPTCCKARQGVPGRRLLGPLFCALTIVATVNVRTQEAIQALASLQSRPLFEEWSDLRLDGRRALRRTGEANPNAGCQTIVCGDDCR